MGIVDVHFDMGIVDVHKKKLSKKKACHSERTPYTFQALHLLVWGRRQLGGHPTRLLSLFSTAGM